MTTLNKPVCRRTREPFAHYRRRIVVTLGPGDVLGMRLERTRTTFTATLAAVYRVLALWSADQKRREKRAKTI
jgi:hypothetical protein